MKQWFCVQTKVKSELPVSVSLKVQGYETYCPQVWVDKRRAIVRVTECMFPRYAFVRLAPGEDNFRPVLKAPGVVSMVRFGLWPAVVPDCVIDDLRQHEDAQGIHSIPKRDYAPGDEVRVKSGPFEGYEAIVQAKKFDRIIVLFNIMGNERRTELLRTDVEPISA
jgi:transcriptional antiterminator RfaH